MSNRKEVEGALSVLIESGAVDGDDPRDVFRARQRILTYESLEGIRAALIEIAAQLARMANRGGPDAGGE